MNNDFSASTTGKQHTSAGGSTSPFDQIAALEAKEQARVQTELDAMAAEEQQVKQALQEKEMQADQEMKDAATQELRTYRETELSAIVQTAENNGHETVQKLEEAYTKQEQELVENLTKEFLQYNAGSAA